MPRKIGREILRKDILGRRFVRTVDFDLHIEPAGSQHGRIDEILPIAGANDDDVAQPLDAVNLRQKLRHDRGFHVR